MPDQANTKQGRGSVMTAAFAVLRRALLIAVLAAGFAWPAAASTVQGTAVMAHGAHHGGGVILSEAVSAGIVSAPGHCPDEGTGRVMACAQFCLMHCGMVQILAMPAAAEVASGRRICEGVASWCSFDAEPVVPPPRSFS